MLGSTEDDLYKNMCRSTGMRIGKSRHSGDIKGDFTFYWSRGKSHIDYLLTENSMFYTISYFSSSIFNIFSDYSLWFSQYRAKRLWHVITRSTPQQEEQVVNQKKWNNDNIQYITNELSCNLIWIDRCWFLNLANVNTCIDSVCNTLNGCVLSLYMLKRHTWW